MIFEVDAEQISGLDNVTLVLLMKRLLLAECQLAGIPLRAAAVPLQITVSDGGEDGRVEWTDGTASTNFLPSRFNIFQAKAQNLTESTVKAEVLAKTSRGKRAHENIKPKLNDAISDALRHRGAYVIFCSHAFTGQKKTKLRKAIEATIVQTGAAPSQLAKIDVYDANTIADWVNTHPSVALWVTSRERRRSVFGLQSYQGWGRSVEIAGVPWIGSDAPRFVPAAQIIGNLQPADAPHKRWTFEQATNAVLKHLSQDHAIVRIAGPSGFGKSRSAYEMFNNETMLADQIAAAALIYADFPIAGDETLKLALEIADAGRPTILVVDECPDETHSRLAVIARRVGSELRLLTIDVETRIRSTKETLLIRLEPAPDKLIGSIARTIAPTLDDSDTRFIQELANGFPRMAVLAAQLGGNRREAIVSIEEFLDRIIWGKRPHDSVAQRALEILSVFDWLGLSGRVREQAAYVAREFAEMSEDIFVEALKSFQTRGIITQRGAFIQVQPIPLAAHLAARRLSLLPDGKLGLFFIQAPRELRLSILRRLRWLDTSAAAQAFARQLLQEDNLGNLAALNSRFGSEALDYLVHVEPDAVMATIDRVLGTLTVDHSEMIPEALLAQCAGHSHC